MCLCVTAGLAAVFIPSALAVHDLNFQLDGDPFASTQTHYGTTTTATQNYDWDSFFGGGAGAISGPTGLTSGFTAGGAVRDFQTKLNNKGATVFDTSDGTTYTIGSKDTLDVSGWSCTPANNVTNKGDIMNTYAVAYTDPATGHQFLYFGLERSDNTGDANVAFWFLQDGTANCTGSNSFSGTHHDGDVLIVAAFTKGGTNPIVNAYKWIGNGATGHLDTTPVANGGACNGGSQPLGDPTCAISNTASKSNWPWQTYNGTFGLGNKVDTGEFFEGGLDLTQTGLAGRCFNDFIADTRSSQSLTATLYDFARGHLGECQTNLATTHGDIAHTPENDNGVGGAAASPADIGGGSVSSGTDTAALQVTGLGTGEWKGTLTFYLCGPLASFPASGPACLDSATPPNQTGVQISQVPIDESDGNVHYFVSGKANLTSAGKYCWSAHFAPDAATTDLGVGPQDDSAGSNDSSECFTVGKASPTLTTCSAAYAADGSCTPSGAVAFGNSISDYAKLSGLAKEPGSNGATNWPTINATNGAYAGSIKFTLRGPSDAGTGCGGTPADSSGNHNPQSLGVDTAVGNKVYGPVSYTPGTPGTYHWQAVMDDLSNATPPVELSVNNTLPATENNATCGDTNEDVTVSQIPTTISTAPFVYPQDSATITSSASGDNIPAGGTVTFYLYNSSANCLLHGSGAGSGLIDSWSFPTFSGDGSAGHPAPAHSETFSTNNTTDAISSSTTVWWRVTYGTGDQAHTGRQSDCVENTQIANTGDSAPGTLFP